MNLFTFPGTCDVCGGEGVGTIRTAAEAWDPRVTIRHTDPRVCRENLRDERERLDREKAQA